MLMRRLARASILPLLLTGLAFAQPGDGPAVQAVIAFTNVLEHEMVESAEAIHGSDIENVARELVRTLHQEGVLADDVMDAMIAAMPAAEIERTSFMVFLLDLLNWTEPYEPRTEDEAEDDLESMYCGLTIPRGRVAADGTGQMLSNQDVGTVVGEFIDRFDCIAPGLRDRYGLPVE